MPNTICNTYVCTYIYTIYFNFSDNLRLVNKIFVVKVFRINASQNHVLFSVSVFQYYRQPAQIPEILNIC
jgi:hypothetical protein